jgi:selenide,water dikinase
MCEASGLAADLDASAVPALPGALELAAAGTAQAGGSARNAREHAAFTDFPADLDPARRALLSDAMTSGGHLAAVPPGAPMDGVRVGTHRGGERGRVGVG